MIALGFLLSHMTKSMPYDWRVCAILALYMQLSSIEIRDLMEITLTPNPFRVYQMKAKSWGETYFLINFIVQNKKLYFEGLKDLEKNRFIDLLFNHSAKEIVFLFLFTISRNTETNLASNTIFL